MLRQVRALWRAGRSWPLLHGVFAGVDRAWWSYVIRRAKIVDVELVAAQLGKPISARAAVRRYVRGGFRDGLTLNALFVEATVRRQLPDSDRVPALYAYLINDQRCLHTSPNWDAPAYAAEHPYSLDDPAGPLGHAWRSALSLGVIGMGSGSSVVPIAWPQARARALRVAATVRRNQSCDWGTDIDATSATVLICLIDPDEDIDLPLRLAAEFAAESNCFSVVLASSLPAGSWMQSSLLTEWAPRVRISLTRTHDLNALVQPMINEYGWGPVVVRGGRAEITVDALRRLADESRRSPVAPLWLAPDGTIASAGVVSHSGRSLDLLRGHPEEDGRILGAEITVQSLAGFTYASTPRSATMPSRTLLDMSVTAPRSSWHLPPAGPDTDLGSLLAPAGLRVKQSGAPAGELAIERVPRRLAGVHEDGVPSLRWAIKTPAPAGTAGQSWGETHFARGLAAALRRLGQDVVIDSFDARNRSTTSLDDVALVLRGPRRMDPPKAGQSILWVISHPDEIAADEITQFNHVFAASTTWALKASHQFAIDVKPLLQCTDATIFRPVGAERGQGAVFVGTARGIARPVVVEPIRVGIPVQVYGPDWIGYIPAASIVADHVANVDLPALYEGANVVLNDHWPAMREAGFISNRAYDAVAAGGRVISDSVEGMDQIFGGAVRTFASIPELLELLRGDIDSLFPSEETLAEIAATVRERDSFDARAKALLDVVLETY